MALRIPLARLEPPHRPNWKSALISAQFGPMAEDLLAVSLVAAASGSGTVARPIVDRGIDLYLRRLRSLLVMPIQVKSFRQLSPDGMETMLLPVAEVPSTNGSLALVHLPEPYDQLYRRIFLVPFDEVHRKFPRTTSQGVESFVVTANFAGSSMPVSAFSVDMDDLAAWIESIPGWAKPATAGPDYHKEVHNPKGGVRTAWEAGVGRLWIASEIERVAAGSVVIAEDRVRLDTVTLLVHHLHGGKLAGLHVRTQRISNAGTVHFEVKRPTFFIDSDMYVLLVLLGRGARLNDFCLLIPSQAIPTLGYSETLTIDPLTKKFAPYWVPTQDVAAAFLSAAFGRASS